MNTRTDYKLSKSWGLAYSAHSNTSFYPEKRADGIVVDFSEELVEDLQEIGEKCGNYEEKYISHFTSWLNAKSRCLSSMITGPANFPVGRAEKAINSERNHYEKFRNWRGKYFKAVNRVKTPSPEEDLDNALSDLDELSNKQELMKLVNKLIRKHHKTMDKHQLEQMLLENEIPESCIKEAMDDSFTGLGFATFQLTNNNAKVKARRAKVEKMRNRIDTKATFEDIVFDGGRITIEDDRVKIFHDSKPDRSVIDSIKSRGFRWSRHWGCWSRKHTANALYVAQSLCAPESIKKTEPVVEEKKEDKVGLAMKKHGAFFAFGDKQFEERKVDGVKYASLGMGIICPVDNYKELVKDLGLKLVKR